MAETLAVDVQTPLGFRVTCSESYWERITAIKHPAMRNRLEEVRQTLLDPDEVRRSVSSPNVLLFHRQASTRWVCAVVKNVNQNGYLLTAYPADKIKHGELLWKK
jgi:hypothetical protein